MHFYTGAPMFILVVAAISGPKDVAMIRTPKQLSNASPLAKSMAAYSSSFLYLSAGTGCCMFRPRQPSSSCLNIKKKNLINQWQCRRLTINHCCVPLLSDFSLSRYPLQLCTVTFSSSELVRDGAFRLFLKVFVAKSFIVFPITGTGKLIWKYGYFVPQ